MIKPNWIILFGISIGSIPTIHLGANREYIDSLRGIILLSPYSYYLSHALIHSINCPIFLIHGKKDKIISYVYSDQIAPKMKILFKWFPSNGNHSNIITGYRCKFYSKLKIFIKELISTLNDDQLNNSFQFNLINSPSKINHKKAVLINENYADNGNYFDINQLNSIETKKNQRLFIIPEVMNKSYCFKGNNNKEYENYYDEDFNDDDSYNSLDNRSTNKHTHKSPYISPLKPTRISISPIKSLKIKQKTEY